MEYKYFVNFKSYYQSTISHSVIHTLKKKNKHFETISIKNCLVNKYEKILVYKFSYG